MRAETHGLGLESLDQDSVEQGDDGSDRLESGGLVRKGRRGSGVSFRCLYGSFPSSSPLLKITVSKMEFNEG